MRLPLRWLFGAIILFSIGVSVWILFQQSIRLDEAQSIWVSTKPISSILRFTGEDVHVPLYGLLLHFWIQLFGTAIVAARSLSFIFYLLTLPVLYLVFKESSQSRTALITTALFAVSPFIIWYSNEARMYTLFTLVASLSHLFFLRLLKSAGKQAKLGYFLATLLGFYTHYFFLFLVGTQFLFSWFRWFTNRNSSDGKFFLKLAWKITGIQIGSAIFFLPWLGYVYSLGTAANTQPLIPPPTSYNFFQALVLFVFGFQNQLVQSLLVSFWPLLVMILFFIFTRKRHLPSEMIDYFATVTFLPIILVFLISIFKPIFLARYLIFVVPTLIYLIVVLLVSYSWRLSRTLILIFLFSVAALLIYQNISPETVVKENYQGVTSYISQQATPEDIVVVSAPFTVYPIEYYYRGRARIDTIPQWDRFTQGAIPAFSEAHLTTQIDNYKHQYARLFVILSYDQGYESQIKNYLDSHLQRLDLKTFSPGLELRVYQLRYDH